MRPLIIKDKYVCKSKINSFKNFKLEDNYFIKEQADGFLVEGKVIVRGDLYYENDNEEIYKEIDVNILIPYEKLESRNMIKLMMDKVEFDKNENILFFKIKINVVGEDELKEKLILGNNRKMEYPPLEEIVEVNENVDFDPSFLKSMEEMLKGNGNEVEVVSTISDNLVEPDIFDVRVEEKEEHNNAVDPLPIVEEDYQEEKVDETNKQEQLLKTEYVRTFFFHRVKNNESLDDILSKYNMSKNDFERLNKKLEVKENDLIQIKIK